MSRPHRRVRRVIPALGTAGFLVVLGAATSPDGRSTGLPPGRAAAIPRSSAWLSRLPDGEAKRKFILDCTGCHQFDAKIARPARVPRTEAQWAEAVTRMLALPKMAVPGVGWLAYVKDTEGNLFGLMQADPGAA